MKVENMISSKGNKVANQFTVSFSGPNNWMDGTITGSGTAFQSYKSVIAFKEYTGKVYLDKNTWDYSVTTGKYRNIFLGENKKETEKKIASGEYILADLN